MVIPPQARPASVALNPVPAINARLTRTAIPARADINQAPAVPDILNLEQHQRNVLAGQHPVLVTSARLTRTAIPARADIKQVLAAAVLYYREQHQRNVPAAQLPAPVTSAHLTAVRAVNREVHALAADTTARDSMLPPTSADKQMITKKSPEAHFRGFLQEK